MMMTMATSVVMTDEHNACSICLLTEKLYTNPTVPPPSITEVSELAKRLNFTLSDDEIEQCHTLMTGAVETFTRLDHLVEPTLPVKYPRTPGYRPSAEENTNNAWYVDHDYSQYYLLFASFPEYHFNMPQVFLLHVKLDFINNSVSGVLVCANAL